MNGAKVGRLASIVALFVLGADARAFGAQPEDEVDEPRVAIQRQKFKMAHEISLGVGLMPLDAFQKGVTASLSYTVHLSDWIAWEVFHVTGAHLTSTDLRDKLIDTFARPPEDFNAPRFMATMGVELSPIYGKQVFLNDTVVHQGLFFGLYAGAIFGDREDMSKTFEDLRPAAGIGIGYRLYLSKLVSLRVDVRDFLSFKRAIRLEDDSDVEQVLHLTGALSFNFWRDDA